MKENKFVAIYQDLADKIQSHQYPVGSLLPSEKELSGTYHVSRETIRKALNLLSQNGYIQKVRGKGSIILDVSRFDFPVSGLVSFKEIAEASGKKWRTNVHELVLTEADSHIAKQLRIPVGTVVWKIIRSREVDGERIILDKDFIRQDLIPNLTKEICEHSLYQYIEQELHLIISYSRKEMFVSQATDEDKLYLSMNDFHHVVVVNNHVFLEDTSLFQYTESRHRLDKFRFVDFARRQSVK
ncbi:trehalose operon repressor [Heyndrickxia ginsengihumi]|uniref:trehalose operon repressor n=1 Tax=Heyndrickxia ginsengihumi TaxID=363870 RepID=UPI00046E5562|nr:trehalose operon repressor [Heyndrickxia ginsengihumi]